MRTTFEGWEEENPDEDDDEDEDDEGEGEGEGAGRVVDADEAATEDDKAGADRDYIVTSHLRHFIVQPYIHPPLLLPDQPFDNRKFHIRTYVVAAGALRIYVYTHMLALFASEPYTPPWASSE